MDLNHIQELVLIELESAIAKFEPFHSTHEGFAVLLEEVDELWESVKLNQKHPDRPKLILEEAIRVAAMIFRFLNDCC